MQQLEQTIDLSRLTLKDWLVLASANNFKPQWGYYQWIDHNPEAKSLSLAHWEIVGKTLEMHPTWAFHRFKEFNP